LIRELGSEEAVAEAVRGEASRWRGRAEKISELEAEVVRLKKMADTSVDQNRSNKMFDSRLNSPEELNLQARDNGDGSSRQDSLSRQDFDDTSTTPFKSSSSSLTTFHSQREMSLKLHEYRTVCQV
jgi:hypothetical protein